MFSLCYTLLTDVILEHDIKQHDNHKTKNIKNIKNMINIKQHDNQYVHGHVPADNIQVHKYRSEHKMIRHVSV